jgi:hypothetical protein
MYRFFKYIKIMIHLKNTNLSNYCLKTPTFIFVISLFSGTVFSDVVMKNKNGEILGPDHKGEVYICDTPNGSLYSVHSNGLQKIYNKGIISEEITWKNCQMNGEYRDYRDGFVYKQGVYKNDKKSGEWTTYHVETGNILKISNYKDGEYHGLVKEYDEKGNEILLTETQYIDGKRDGLQKDYDRKTGKLYLSSTYVQDGLNGETIRFTNLNNPPDVFRSHLYDFWNVMSPSGYGGYYKGESWSKSKGKSWRYTNRCWDWTFSENYNNKKIEYYKKQGKVDCLSSERQVFVSDKTPIKITMNYQGGILHGPLVISDPDDGHIYTSIEYFRGGKYGEYKITNKEGNVIFSVNCLKGGKDYTLYRTNIPSGVCKKDGEEIKYRRSIFSPNQDWYLHSKKVYQNGNLVKVNYFDDPNYQEGMIVRTLECTVSLPLVKDPSLISDKESCDNRYIKEYLYKGGDKL